MSDYLPEELMVEILTRLSPKSLLRFWCVCKSWYSLITSPNFIEMHTQQHTLSNHNPRILVRSYSTVEYKELYSVHFNNDSFNLDPESKIKFPFEGNSRCYFRIVGSCNGLLCVSISDKFGYSNNVILWNPAIRRRLVLPSPHGSLADVLARFRYPLELGFCKIRYVLGFGFDPKTNDFKVVRISYVQNYGGYLSSPTVEVYTAKGGVWRGINSSSPPPVNCVVDFYSSQQAFVNGAVHWAAYHLPGRHVGRDSHLIMSLDMSDEVFGEVMLPECLNRDMEIDIHALVVGERLSVFQCDMLDRVNSGNYCSIWVMKEYGVAESWCKLCNIDLGERLGRALDVRKNDEIFLGEFCIDIISYNPGTKGYLDFEFPGSKPSVYVDTYRESLALFLEGDEIWDGQLSDAESDSSEDDKGVESNVERPKTWIQMVTMQFLTALLTEH